MKSWRCVSSTTTPCGTARRSGLRRTGLFQDRPTGLVGTELEWIVASADDPTARADPCSALHRILDTAGPPPRGSCITFEPGGQVELSSPPPARHHRLLAGPRPPTPTTSAARSTPRALASSRPRSTRYRPPQRQLRHPRYDAMARYFDRARGTHGPIMMNSTAAVQVNLDIGRDPQDAARRWRLLHAVGPLMWPASPTRPCTPAATPAGSRAATGLASIDPGSHHGARPATTR